MSFLKKTVNKVMSVWKECADTPFIRKMQPGTLEWEKFTNYMVQDILYLKHYARVMGMAVYKAAALKEIQLYYEMLGFVGGQESAVLSRHETPVNHPLFLGKPANIMVIKIV